jgi:hypothetical protein
LTPSHIQHGLVATRTFWIVVVAYPSSTSVLAALASNSLDEIDQRTRIYPGFFMPKILSSSGFEKHA